jgi:CHAT domain-containing protein
VDTDAAAADQLARATRLVSTMDLAPLQLVLALAGARMLRRTGELEEAAQRLRTALARATYAPQDTTTDAELRIALHAADADAAAELIDVLLEHGTQQACIEAWQRASATRVGTLNEYLQRASEARANGSDPSSPSAGLADISRLYDEMYDEMATRGADVDTTLLLQAREAELRLLEAVAGGAREPATTDRTRTGRTPVPLAPPGPTPVPEGPVLQYHVLRSDVVAFVVREGQVHARRLRGVADPTRQLARTWRAECSRLGSAARVVADLPVRPAGTEALTELHHLLIEPIEDLIDDLYGQPLLVIPHRHLFSVPFEALAGDGEPLCERFRLAFCIGLTADSFAALPADSKVDPGSTLVVAVPDERAPAISVEADLVASLRPDAEVFVGAGALSRTLARRAAGKEVVHVACHATFRPDNPMRSGLLLSDGWMTAGQIVDLDLTDSLVVLSACGSGRSSDTLAEPAGLAWAFTAAGCRAVVASTWVVDDDATRDFMHAFYVRLASGQAPRDALEQARSEIARTRPHPYHWAAFRYLCSPTTALEEGLSP